MVKKQSVHLNPYTFGSGVLGRSDIYLPGYIS